MRLAVDHKVVGVEAGRRLAEVAGLLSLSLSLSLSCVIQILYKQSVDCHS